MSQRCFPIVPILPWKQLYELVVDEVFLQFIEV